MRKPIRVAFLVVDNRFDKDLPRPLFGTAPTALLKGFEEIGGSEVEIHVVSCLARPLHCPEKLADNIWFHGKYVSKWGFLRTLHSGCVMATREMVSRINPDVVHAQGTERWCAISGMFMPYPRLLTLHGILRVIDPLVRLRPRPYWKLQTFLERIATPRYDGAVCITSHARQQIMGIARQTWIVPNATEPSYFAIKPNPIQDPSIILYIGSVYSLKNQVGFIKALEPLALDHHFIIRFCGTVDRNTEYGAALGKLVDKHPWCEEAGHLNREQVGQHLTSATMLALASFEENCPMVILEAMSAGVPVVASQVGGIPDLIQDGVNGLLCNPHDPESIRHAVKRILVDHSLRDSLATEARRQAEIRYTPIAVARQHLEIYRELLDQKKSNQCPTAR